LNRRPADHWGPRNGAGILGTVSRLNQKIRPDTRTSARTALATRRSDPPPLVRSADSDAGRILPQARGQSRSFNFVSFAARIGLTQTHLCPRVSKTDRTPESFNEKLLGFIARRFGRRGVVIVLTLVGIGSLAGLVYRGGADLLLGN